MLFLQHSLSLPGKRGKARGTSGIKSSDALIEPFGIIVTVNVDNPPDTLSSGNAASDANDDASSQMLAEGGNRSAPPNLALVIAVQPRIKVRLM